MTQEKYQDVFTIDSETTVNIKRTHPKNVLRYKTVPIQNDAFWAVSIHVLKEDTTLAKLYAALSHITGEGDSLYDDYKGSYSFTFEIEVNKNGNISEYLYCMFHYRSYIEFSLYRIVTDRNFESTTAYQQPEEEFFSQQDISSFSVFFCLYLLKLTEDYVPEPFVKCSESNLIIFGHDGSDYFAYGYDDQNEFYKEKEKLEATLIKT